MDNNIPYALPSFREDPAFYDDCIVTYFQELSRLGQEVAIASEKKPSLSDYDGVSLEE